MGWSSGKTFWLTDARDREKAWVRDTKKSIDIEWEGTNNIFGNGCWIRKEDEAGESQCTRCVAGRPLM